MPPECRMTLEARREDNDTDTALLVKLQDLKIGDQALEVKNSVKQLKRAIQEAVNDLAMKEILKNSSSEIFMNRPPLGTQQSRTYMCMKLPLAVFILTSFKEGMLKDYLTTSWH